MAHGGMRRHMAAHVVTRRRAACRAPRLAAPYDLQRKIVAQLGDLPRVVAPHYNLLRPMPNAGTRPLAAHEDTHRRVVGHHLWRRPTRNCNRSCPCITTTTWATLPVRRSICTACRALQHCNTVQHPHDCCWFAAARRRHTVCGRCTHLRGVTQPRCVCAHVGVRCRSLKRLRRPASVAARCARM